MPRHFTWRLGAFAALLAIAAAACSFSVGGGINTDEIITELERQTGVDVTGLQCPSPPANAGEAITCTATRAAGGPFPVTVSRTADGFEWRTDASLELDMGALEQQITEGITNTGAQVQSVSCPDSRPTQADDTFDCTATLADGSSATVRVTQTDDTGNVEWEVVQE